MSFAGRKKSYIAQNCQRGGLVILDPGQGCCQSWYVQQPKIGNENSTSLKIILEICGAFNKFPDIFVQTFKIVVDSRKFTMLLLYILCDDWPIFMISGSNEQLQQQLEYTLLKPDYHSWWISKMQSQRADTLEEQYAIKFCFKFGKNDAPETYGTLQTAFWTILHESSTSFWVV